MHIARATPDDAKALVELRAALWPGAEPGHAGAWTALLAAGDDGKVVFLAHDADRALGFAEAGLRHDYVNGCDTTAVAFLEGIYVRTTARGHGVATALVAAIAAWGAAAGCRELASDSAIDNLDSRALHRALGFEETEQVVFFRRQLGDG